jgi:ATP-dependent Clp protease ATP-binding subunit ClpB
VLDDGRLTDNKGRIADFKNTIIIMTSNLGSSIIQENYEKVNNVDDEKLFEKTKDSVIQLLRKTIRPEFLNRIDEILMFKPLSKQEIRQIVMLQIDHLKTLLAHNEINVKLTSYAFDALADMGYDPLYGARPLKRVIQKNILNNLSKIILSNTVRKEVPITIDVIDEQFVFYNEKDK